MCGDQADGRKCRSDHFRTKDAEQKDLLEHRTLFSFADHAHDRGIKDQEYKRDADRKIPLLAFADLFIEDQISDHAKTRSDKFFFRKSTEISKRLISHDHDQERNEKSLAVRDLVREMEAVPDIGHHTAAEAYVHDCKSDTVSDTLSQTDLFTKEEQRDQHRNENTAVDIGHTVTDVRIRSYEETADEIEQIVGNGELLREGAAGRGRFLKRDISRQSKESREASGDQGICAETPYRRPEVRKRNLLRDGNIKDRCIEDQEQAYEITGIKIRDQAHGKGDTIKKRLLLFHEFDQAENDQRKEHDGIVPHNVPKIGDRPAAKCVGRSKSGQKKVFSALIEFFEKI